MTFYWCLFLCVLHLGNAIRIRQVLILQFFYNNYLNNHNYNNKSDKIKILRIRMVARHYQWRCVNASVPLTCLCTNDTESDVFQFCFIFFNFEWIEILVWIGPVGKMSLPRVSFSFFFKEKITKKVKKKERGKTSLAVTRCHPYS
jgi:hypothetical protein